MSIPKITSDQNDASVVGYEILSELGRGGMGVVYKARQTALNRIVALKMILSGRHTGESQLARFRAEAEALAKIQHPNIVQVYDVGTHQGHPYIALEYVEGGNLAEKLKNTPQPPRAAARLVELLARAIQTAHEAGIIHRDLKPVNILLNQFILGESGTSPSSSHHQKSGSKSISSGRSGTKQSILSHVSVDYGTPKITDFGLAKQEEGAASGLTHAGSIMGTPSYMSPEQAIGDIGLIGPATDVYALGAILYEMLTGRPPFRADTPVNTIMQVIRGEVVSPSKLVAKLPIDLETITLKCLEKGPHRRYETAAALADDLDNYLEDRPISARPAGRVERTIKWIRRHPMITSFIVATVCAAIAFVVLGVWAYLAVTDRAHAAEQAQELASKAARENKQRLIRLAVANGAQLLDRGELMGGAAWFAEALKLDENNHAGDVMHRKRLASVLARCPILAHLWEHEAAVNSIALSPDGNTIATGGNDGLIRLWSLKDGKAVNIPLEHGSAIAFLEFAPGGQELVVLSQDGTCKLWRWGKNAEQRIISQGMAIARYSRDGTSIITIGTMGGLVIYRRNDLQRITGQLSNNGATADIALSPDGNLALVPSSDGFVRLWDLAKATLKVPPMKQGSQATAVAIHPTGKLGATGGENGQVWLWNLTTGELALPIPWQHDGAVLQVQFSPDGRWLATCSEDKQCIVWEVATGKQYSPRLKHGSRVNKVLFSPDGLWVATLSEDNFARVWDIRSGTIVGSPFRNNGTPQSFCFTSNGRGLLTAGRDHLLRHWILPIPLDELTDQSIYQAAAQQAMSPQSRLLTSPDGKQAANFGGDQPVRIRDAATLEPRSAPLKTGGATSALAFSHNNDWLATGGADGLVQVWSASSGEARWKTPGQHTSRVYTIAFHPNGHILATGSDDNTVRVWNAETGQPLFAPIRHDGAVYWLSFSADGNTLCSASIDGTTRVWDTATGEPITPKLPAWNGKPWKDELDATPIPVDDLLALTQALTGMEVDKQGGMTLLNAHAIHDRYAKVQNKSEQTYIPTDDTIWHEYHAQAAEKQNQWFAAAWQLEQLTRSDARSTDYRRRLAHAWGQLGAWQKVIETANELLRNNPANIDGWLQRGQAYGELKQWRESVRDISQAARLQQQPEWRPLMPAWMKLEQNDTAGFEKDCLTLLQKEKLEPWEKLAVVTLAVARPCSAATLQKLQPWMDEISKSTTIEAQILHAALLLRADQPKEALAKIKAIPTTTDYEATRLLWQALAEQKLNQAPFAQVSLQKAKQLLTENTNIPHTWQDDLLARTLLQEAEGK